MSTDANCFGGKPPRAYTFMEAALLCVEAGLDMCDRSCANEGCGYNMFPVWTNAPCPLSTQTTTTITYGTGEKDLGVGDH